MSDYWHLTYSTRIGSFGTPVATIEGRSESGKTFTEHASNGREFCQTFLTACLLNGVDGEFWEESK